jgi:hypothetical protein
MDEKKGSRTFTPAELEEMEKNFNQLALEALDRGDIEKARHWVKRNEETKEYIHAISTRIRKISLKNSSIWSG